MKGEGDDFGAFSLCASAAAFDKFTVTREIRAERGGEGQRDRERVETDCGFALQSLSVGAGRGGPPHG